ncbi:MAG TPA: glycosyltransferase family 9 protein [Candidatus Baltobacteraceae bacterium]|nr:glycosyltransferase family 9 protein [Candidatus Baltobacteraceae bacterium]
MSAVLIVRLDAIGDALALTPLVAALRDAGHRVGALLTTVNAQTFAESTLERVHVVERDPWPNDVVRPASYVRALEEVRAVHYDVALIATEKADGYAFAADAKIPERTGFYNGLSKPLKGLWVRRRLTRRLRRTAVAQRQVLHEVETLFALGEGLHNEGAPTKEVGRLRPLVVDGAREQHGRIVIQVTPKLADEGLGADLYARIAREVALRHPVVLTESPHNAAFARKAAERSGADFVPTSIAEWKQMIDGAAALVSPDSGAAHIAGMVGTPCIDLFGDGPLTKFTMQQWRPWASLSESLVVSRRTATALPAKIAESLERVMALAGRA